MSAGQRVGVLAQMDRWVESICRNGGTPYDASAARAAVVELIEQQKRDYVLVDVLLGYINAGLTVHEKARLVTELSNRGLADHIERRTAALANIEPQT